MLENREMRKDRNVRNDIFGEHRFGDTGQLIFAVIFGIVYVLDSFVFGKEYADYMKETPMFIPRI